MSQLKTNLQEKTALTTDLMTELKQALREIVDMIFHTTEVGVEEIRYHQYLVPSPITHPVLRPLCSDQSDHPKSPHL